MGRHLKPHTKQEAIKYTNQILRDNRAMSRWLALMNGVRAAQAYENKLGLEETDLDGQNLIDYVEEHSAEIEENLVRGTI